MGRHWIVPAALTAHLTTLGAPLPGQPPQRPPAAAPDFSALTGHVTTRPNPVSGLDGRVSYWVDLRKGR